MSKTTPTTTQPPKHVVIAGAGIIGTSTAYYLAENHGITSTIVDPTGTVAPAASGKAGGFLARDWNDYSPTQQLTRRSFHLHQELADKFGAESIQYRRLTCAAISVNPNSTTRRPKGKKLDGVEWASDQSTSIRSLGSEETIAQVHPKLLCERLWEAASSKGCVLKEGKVVDIVRDDDNDESFVGAKLEDGSTVNGDAILFACGPWTTNNIMMGVKYHSAVVKTDRVLSQCVFFSGSGDPEVYVRPDQTAYCTGFPEPARVVTEKPGKESVDPAKIATIVDAVREATAATTNNSSLELRKDPVLQQACYLPTTIDGIPCMGQIPDDSACYISAGHSCWGILLGPAAGESMASLIGTGKSTEHVDLSPFNPARYKNIKLVPVGS